MLPTPAIGSLYAWFNFFDTFHVGRSLRESTEDSNLQRSIARQVDFSQ